MKSKFQKIKGTYDILPPEIEKWSQATSILQSISKQFGYEEIKTPIIEITKYIMLDFKKMFTIDAMIIPINPIIKKDPSFVKSLLVVYP